VAEPLFHVALVHPEIPGNAGNVGRLCMNVGARLHLVHPLGFSTHEKAVRRAGLDYWREVDVREHPDLPAFEAWCSGRRVHAFSTLGSLPYTAGTYAEGDVLVLGCESVGLSAEYVAAHETFRIPMLGPTRSLNLANAAAVVAYEVLHQLRPELFAGPPPRR
jgi:tRNA (cytidine/uridine-2'-O-)-methyltransferase